jgi:2-polyprenyl-6-methoxyphenol hydroxylase-like FAD-dependent oxidoreductase
MLASADAGAQCRQRCAVIVGGSMSGLFTAALLRQTGWEVDVYERSRNWSGGAPGS